jgi:hypothetical protein
LLVAFGVLPADTIDAYTGYRGAVDALSGFSGQLPTGQGARAILGVVGVLVSLVALALILRELTFGRPAARSAVLEDEPGRETKISAKAVRSISEGAAREAGAVSSNVTLGWEKGAYEILCGIEVPESGSFAGLAEETQRNIRTALQTQNVPVKVVEVTVRATAPA